MKILVIEDELLIQKSLKKMLELRGAQVEAVARGTEAISLLQRSSYDRVICDLMLNDITGFDIIEETKKRYSDEEISKIFIIISAYSSPQVLEKAQKYGCKILNKPFTNLNHAIDIFLNENINEKN